MDTLKDIRFISTGIEQLLLYRSLDNSISVSGLNVNNNSFWGVIEVWFPFTFFPQSLQFNSHIKPYANSIKIKKANFLKVLAKSIY